MPYPRFQDDILPTLEKICNKAGINLKCVESILPQFRSPFNEDVGIDKENHVIFYTPFLLEHAIIIHELGHCLFGCLKNGEEYNFFGWEYAIAKKYNILKEWIASQAIYIVGEEIVKYDELSSLSEKQQNFVFNRRVRAAKKFGYIVDDDPILNRLT